MDDRTATNLRRAACFLIRGPKPNAGWPDGERHTLWLRDIGSHPVIARVVHDQGRAGELAVEVFARHGAQYAIGRSIGLASSTALEPRISRGSGGTTNRAMRRDWGRDR